MRNAPNPVLDKLQSARAHLADARHFLQQALEEVGLQDETLRALHSDAAGLYAELNTTIEGIEADANAAH